MKPSVWAKRIVSFVSELLKNETHPKFYEFLQAMEVCQFWLLNENDTVSNDSMRNHFYAYRNDFMLRMIEKMAQCFRTEFQLSPDQKAMIEREFLLQRANMSPNEVYRSFIEDTCKHIPYKDCIALILANAANGTFFEPVKF